MNPNPGSTNRSTTSKLALAAALALSAAPAAAPAAVSGLAWDSVTKMSIGADPSSLQPGSFDADYAAAASGSPSSGGGGLFGHMVPGGIMALMQNGMAQRHYIAGSKERTDQPAMGTATILDCGSRTLTTLDLKKKTYRVVSLDQPNSSPAPSKGGNGDGSFKGDDTKIAIVITNQSLGSREIDDQPTNGYRSQMQFTMTKSSGESETHDGNLIAYYAGFGMPAVQCSPGMPSNLGRMNPGQRFGMIPGVASQVMRVLATAGLDKRFSVQQSGPSLPLGNFAMYQAISFDQRGRSMTLITERGNSRPIDAADSIFTIPSDFTKEQ
jgi:hypothetical protein